MLAAAAAQEGTILGQKTLSPQGSPDETPDELRSYLGIADDDTRHETVNHKAEVWVIWGSPRGDDGRNDPAPPVLSSFVFLDRTPWYTMIGTPLARSSASQFRLGATSAGAAHQSVRALP